jgi:hypothetical protein
MSKTTMKGEKVMKQFYLKHFLAVFSPTRLAAVVAAGLLSIAAIAFAYDTPIAGGNGGQSYSLSCGNNRALVGIRGKEGSFVDRVQGVCAQINFDGSWQGDTTTTGTAGGVTNNNFNLTCPTGQAVTEITGKSGWYIDKLKVRCGALGQNGRFTNLGNYLSGVAGNSSVTNNFGPLTCLNNQPARLIQGRAATYVDAIGLGCEYVNTLRLIGLNIAPSPTRVGQTTSSATVRMSLIPAATATVSLASSSTGVATVAPATAVGTNTTQGIASITPRAPGCTTITASYKGSSASSGLLVHSAASPGLSLTTPATVTLSQPTNMTVTIPSNSTVNLPITLTNVDNIAMQIPNQVIIHQNQRSASFQVIMASTGCVRIKATDNRTGATVTNAFKVVR